MSLFVNDLDVLSMYAWQMKTVTVQRLNRLNRRLKYGSRSSKVAAKRLKLYYANAVVLE